MRGGGRPVGRARRRSRQGRGLPRREVRYEPKEASDDSCTLPRWFGCWSLRGGVRGFGLPPIWPRHFFGVLEWDSERWSAMGGIRRKADGRRIFSVEFKRQAVGRVHSGEKTMAELSRELEIQPSVLRNWMRAGGARRDGGGGCRGGRSSGQPSSGARAAGQGAAAAGGQAGDDHRDPRSSPRAGKKKSTLVQRIRSVTGVPMAAVCRTLKVARSTAYLRSRPRQGRFYRRAEDTEVLYEILAVTRQRASYGVRRTWAMVNRARRRDEARSPITASGSGG